MLIIGLLISAGAPGANVIPILPSSTSMDEMKQKMGKLFQKPSGQPFWKKWPKIYIRHLVILAINIHCYFYTIIYQAPFPQLNSDLNFWGILRILIGRGENWHKRYLVFVKDGQRKNANNQRFVSNQFRLQSQKV